MQTMGVGGGGRKGSVNNMQYDLFAAPQKECSNCVIKELTV